MTSTRWVRMLIIVGVAMLAGATACDTDDDDDTLATTTTEEPTTTTAEGVALDQTCTTEGDESGVDFSVDYPEGWHTNEGDTVPPCRYFDPEPFDVPEATEFFTAVMIRVDAVEFERVRDADETAPGAPRVVRSEDTTVEGRDAVVRELEHTGEGLHEEGTRSYQYLVDLDGQTMFVESIDFDPEQPDGLREDVVDAMVDSLEVTVAAGTPGTAGTTETTDGTGTTDTTGTTGTTDGAGGEDSDGIYGR